MSSILCNGFPLTELHLTEAIDGAWVADVEYAADEAPSGEVTLSDESRSMVGHVLPSSSGELAGLVRARLVAGRAGLRQTLGAKSWQAARVRDVLSDTLRGAEESLSLLSSPASINTLLQFWTRPEQSCGDTVAALADHVGSNWRVLDDGSVWVGVDEFRSSESTALTLDAWDQHGFALVAPESLDLRVGTTFEGRRVRQVQYFFSDGHLRARYWWQ